ncbi:glycosyltransferase family 4 protein [Patescibacteria group bacterium]|nr:glycosyltransferase family 4 protein [Patescibacteria group bacterium]
MNDLKQQTLAIVAPYFPPHGGGLEKYAFEIATRLQKQHHWHVVVITTSERYGHDEKIEMSGLTVYRLGYYFKLSNTPFSVSWVTKIQKILKEENPNVINIHMPVPGIGDITAMLAGKRPVIVTYHAGSMMKSDKSNLCLINILIALYENGPLGMLLRRANHIICSSNSVRLNFLSKYSAKTSTITPAVDVSIFSPMPEKRAKRPTILFVAGLGIAEQHKGLITLIEAVKALQSEMPNVHLVIVGDGDMRNEYEHKVKELDLQKNVSFTGRLTGADLSEQYQRAHVFALPSINESFGMTIIEAMASGLPVVASNIGDIPSLVTDSQTGFLIPPGNVGLLKEKLLELLQNPELERTFGIAGYHKVVQGFNWNDRGAEYSKILLEYEKR